MPRELPGLKTILATRPAGPGPTMRVFCKTPSLSGPGGVGVKARVGNQAENNPPVLSFGPDKLFLRGPRSNPKPEDNMDPKPGPALRYHLSVSYDRRAMDGYFLDWAAQPRTGKDYSGFPRIELPERFGFPGVPLARAAEGRAPAEKPRLTLERLSRILFCAYGTTALAGGPGREFRYRSAPSAGALYPVELYLALAPAEAGEVRACVRPLPLPQPGARVDPAAARGPGPGAEPFFPLRHNLPLGLEVPGPGLPLLQPGHGPRGRKPAPGPSGRGVCPGPAPGSSGAKGRRLSGAGCGAGMLAGGGGAGRLPGPPGVPPGPGGGLGRGQPGLGGGENLSGDGKVPPPAAGSPASRVGPTPGDRIGALARPLGGTAPAGRTRPRGLPGPPDRPAALQAELCAKAPCPPPSWAG